MGCRSCLARRVGISVFEPCAQPLMQLPERFGALFEWPGLDVGQLRGEIDRFGFGVHVV